MTMFDTVKQKAAKLFGIQHTDFASLSRAAYDLLEQNGGIPGLQARFQAAGLGEIFQSWLSGEAKLPISAEQVQKIFGTESLRLVAEKESLPAKDFSEKLAESLPKIIEALAPDRSDKNRQPTQ